MRTDVRKSAFSRGTSVQCGRVLTALTRALHLPAQASHRRLCVSVLLFAITLFLFGQTASPQSLSVYERDFVRATFQSPGTIFSPAVSAGAAVAWSDYVLPTDGYGPSWQGYGHHYVVSLADNVNGKFMRKFVFAAASHRQDNYIPTSGGFRARVALAAAHTIYASPGANGWKLNSKTLNWSGIPASLTAAALSNVYQPAAQRNWDSTFKRVGTATAGYALGNVLTALFVDLKQMRSRLLQKDRAKDLEEIGTHDSP
jgi:hypothetical protein